MYDITDSIETVDEGEQQEKPEIEESVTFEKYTEDYDEKEVKNASS